MLKLHLGYHGAYQASGSCGPLELVAFVARRLACVVVVTWVRLRTPPHQNQGSVRLAGSPT